jgi:hypothetical protein
MLWVRPRCGRNPTEEFIMKKRFFAAAAALAVVVSVAVPAVSQANAGRVSYCTAGDPPIQVSDHTSCAFAINAVDHAYQWGLSRYARIYSPVTHKAYWLTYRTNWYTGNVTVTGPNGIWMQFYYGN